MHVELKLEVVSVVYLISRVKSPRDVCRGSFEQCSYAQAGTCPQAQGEQARDRRVAVLKLPLLAV